MPSKSKSINNKETKATRSFAEFFGFKRNKKTSESNNNSREECYKRQSSALSLDGREGRHHDASSHTNHLSKTQSLDRKIFSSKRKKKKSLRIFNRKEKSFDMDSTNERENKDEVFFIAKPIEFEITQPLEVSSQLEPNETVKVENKERLLNKTANERLKLDASKAIQSFDLDKMILRKQSTSKNIAVDVENCGNHSLPSFHKIDKNTKTIVLSSLVTRSPKVGRKFSEQTSCRMPRQGTLDRTADGRRKNDNTRKYSLPLRRNITRKSPIILKKYTDHSLLVKPKCEDEKEENPLNGLLKSKSQEHSLNSSSKSLSDVSIDDVDSINYPTLTESNDKLNLQIDRLSKNLSVRTDSFESSSNINGHQIETDCDSVEDQPVKYLNDDENKLASSTKTPGTFECLIKDNSVVMSSGICSQPTNGESKNSEQKTSSDISDDNCKSSEQSESSSDTEHINGFEKGDKCIEKVVKDVTKSQQHHTTRTKKHLFNLNDLEIIITIGKSILVSTPWIYSIIPDSKVESNSKTITFDHSKIKVFD